MKWEPFLAIPIKWEWNLAIQEGYIAPESESGNLKLVAFVESMEHAK